MSKLWKNPGVIFIILGLLIFGSSRQYKPLSFIKYGPGFFPAIIGIVVAISGVFQIVLHIKSIRETKETCIENHTEEHVDRLSSKISRESILKISILIGWSLSYIFLIKFIGFLPVTFVGLFLFFMLSFENKKTALILGLFCTIFFQFVFGNLLSVQFPLGILDFLSGVLSWNPY